MHAMATPRDSNGLAAALDAYERAFDWIGLCLACGHAPANTHDAMQRLYQVHLAQHARVDLYPLVSAHWDVVCAAEAVAAAPSVPERDARQLRVRGACQAHREAVHALRNALCEELL
jgi:hypothetical protein